MESDFINGTFLILAKQNRTKELIDFCRKIADECSAKDLKCIALRNLSEACFFMAGDGETARQANLEGLAILDENRDLLEIAPNAAPEVMKHIYSDFCEQFRAIAISLDEYDEYAHKAEIVRPMNATEIRGLQVTADYREKGVSWKEDMFIRVENYYPQQQMAQHTENAGQAASILSLILKNRRSLRLNRTDLNFSIQQYCNAVCDLVVNQCKACNAASQQIDPDNYLFVLEKARALIADCADDCEVDETTINLHLNVLDQMKQQIINESQKISISPPDPDQAELERETGAFFEAVRADQIYLQSAGDPVPGARGGPQVSPAGCGIFTIVFSLIIIIVCAWIYAAKTNAPWWQVLLAFSPSLLILVYFSRKFRKR